MQNKYAGDVGDFGKLGMLRHICAAGLSLGVNWYLMPDDGNNDGKHVAYLHDPQFIGCDDELLDGLKDIVENKNRNVHSIEQAHLIPNAVFYSQLLGTPSVRSSWHRNALEALEPCELVFLDPDNGLLPKSKSASRKDGGKYVLEDELINYYERGQSVIFYNHKSREDLEVYFDRFRMLKNSGRFVNAQWLCLKFSRVTVRHYFFILQPRHSENIRSAMENMLDSAWHRHFEKIIM